jgi:hypothetical protein
MKGVASTAGTEYVAKAIAIDIDAEAIGRGWRFGLLDGNFQIKPNVAKGESKPGVAESRKSVPPCFLQVSAICGLNSPRHTADASRL